MGEAQIDGSSRPGVGPLVILQAEIEAGLEQDLVSTSIQKNGSKIREQKRTVLPGSLGVLTLRIAENGEVMVDSGLFKRHSRKRFHWGRHCRLLLHIRDRSLCFSQLLLQFLDFLLVLFVNFLILRVNLAVLRMRFFELIDSLVLFFDLLA